MFTFDGTVNLGQIIEIVSVACVALGGVVKMLGASGRVREDVIAVHKRLDGVDTKLEKQTEILVGLGEQGARLTNLESQMTLLHEQLLAGAFKHA